MTEQPPSAESLWTDLVEKDDRTSPEEYPDMALITFDEFEYLLNHFAERVCEQRVSAEREGIARLLEQVADPADESDLGEEAADAFNGGGHKRSMTDRLVSWNAVLAKAIRAPAERPAPPQQRFPTAAQAEKMAYFSLSDEAFCPHQAVRELCPVCASGPSSPPPSPAAVVDYTERAREIVDGVIDKHQQEYRELYAVASIEFRKDLSNAIAAALSAVASEHQAKIAAAKSDCEIALKISREMEAERDAALARLARLREPDVRSALRSAFMGVPNWQVRGEPTNVEVAGDLADAAIARIVEMLK